MALRDTRHIRFNDSLLGTIETSLGYGPVHFDHFPNFIVGLYDPHIMKALTLNIKTHRTLLLQGVQQIASYEFLQQLWFRRLGSNTKRG